MYNFDDLKTVVHQIRNNCPWDKEQNHESLKRYLIEEAYEVLEAIDDGDFDELEKELGDVLLQVMLHSEIANEKDYFDVHGVIHQITDKMIIRHPHVFQKTDKPLSSKEVLENWEHIKSKTTKRSSVLDGIPKQLPALMQAQRMQEKSAQLGFDWKNREDVQKKVLEELDEFLQEEETNPKAKEEFGDLLFSLVNLGRHLNYDIESVLQESNKKYARRFRYVEEQYSSHEEMKSASLEDLDRNWNKAKERGL